MNGYKHPKTLASAAAEAAGAEVSKSGAEKGHLFWIGNHPAIDFLNTRPCRDGQPIEILNEMVDLVLWLSESGLVAPKDLTVLDPGLLQGAIAEAALQRGRQMREGLREVIRVARQGEPIPSQLIEDLNQLLQSGHAFTQLVGDEGQFHMEQRWNFKHPEDLLVPIAKSIADLLTEVDLGRVRQCNNPACVLLFYDTSKNRSRRWCSMQTCGNRLKVARHRRGRRAKIPND